MTAAVAIPPPPFELPEAVRRNFAVRPELSLRAWAERHVRICEGPLVEQTGHKPLWSPETFPLQSTIIEAVGDAARWSKVWLMAPPQASGKSQAAAIPALLYGVEYRRCSVAYVSATLDQAVTQWERKILPAMKADEALAKLIYKNPDMGGKKGHRKFTNGAAMFFAGTDSMGALSNFTAPFVICDDIQAAPESLPGAGSPIDLAWKRSEAYPSDSVIHVGIAQGAGTVDAFAWRALCGSAFYCPFVPCPACGTYQLLEFGRLESDGTMRCANDGHGVETDVAAENVKPDGEDRDEVGAPRRGSLQGGTGGGRSRKLGPIGAGALVDRVCTHRMTFDELPAMLERYLFISMPPGASWITQGLNLTIDPATACIYPNTERNTNECGLWMNALYWPIGKTWLERYHEQRSARDDPDRDKDHQQQIRVIPWAEPEIDEEALTEDELRAHATPGYAAGTVPAAADVVTVTIDVQSGYVYYLICAWNKADGTQWLVDMGTKGRPLTGREETPAEKTARRALLISHGLDAVDELCARGWDTVDDAGEVVGHIDQTLGLIDRGFVPDVVAGWHAARHRGVWRTIRGEKAGKRALLWPPKAERDRRGRPLRVVNVNSAKHIVRRLLRVQPGPGYWHLPATGIHSNTMKMYYRHMTVERFNRERTIPRWEDRKNPASPRKHDIWDCHVYAVSAAVACGVRLPGIEATKKIKAGYTKRSDRPRTWKIGR